MIVFSNFGKFFQVNVFKLDFHVSRRTTLGEKFRWKKNHLFSSHKFLRTKISLVVSKRNCTCPEGYSWIKKKILKFFEIYSLCEILREVLLNCFFSKLFSSRPGTLREKCLFWMPYRNLLLLQLVRKFTTGFSEPPPHFCRTIGWNVECFQI